MLPLFKPLWFLFKHVFFVCNACLSVQKRAILIRLIIIVIIMTNMKRCVLFDMKN